MEWEEIRRGAVIPHQLIERYEKGPYPHGISITSYKEGVEKIYFILLHQPKGRGYIEGKPTLMGRFLGFGRNQQSRSPFGYQWAEIDAEEWRGEGNIHILSASRVRWGGFWDEEGGGRWHLEHQDSSIYLIKDFPSHQFLNWNKNNPMEAKR